MPQMSSIGTITCSCFSIFLEYKARLNIAKMFVFVLANMQLNGPKINLSVIEFRNLFISIQFTLLCNISKFAKQINVRSRLAVCGVSRIQNSNLPSFYVRRQK